MKRILLIVVLSFMSTVSFGQVGLVGGFSTLFPFGGQRVYPGLTFGVEVPRSSEVSFFGTASYFFPKKESYDVLVVNSTTFLLDTMQLLESFNYFNIKGGTRYYLMNGYDDGLSIYGGTEFGIVVNKVKFTYDFEDKNPEDYQDATYGQPLRNDKGSILSLGIGLGGGVKYTIPAQGTLFMDMSGMLMVTNIVSNPAASQTSFYSPLIFTVTMGFRKDLY